MPRLADTRLQLLCGDVPGREVVAPDFMSMGADVQWLSAFPGEAEIIYPPLIYLKPTGREQVPPGYTRVANKNLNWRSHPDICIPLLLSKPNQV